MVYDPVRDRLIVFGGSDGQRRSDVWCLSLSGTSEWTRLEVANPIPPRYRHSAIYDPIRDRVLVFGGNLEGDNTNETLALSLSGTPTWSYVITPTAPPSRREHSAIYDPVRDRMIIYGGYHAGAMRDAWALSLSGDPFWTPIWAGVVVPEGRYRHAAIYDPIRDRMVVYGGHTFDCRVGIPCDTLLHDTWSLSLSSGEWTQLAQGGTAPGPREEHVAVYDAANDRMLIHGGADPTLRAEVWALPLADPQAWTPVATVGATLRGRNRHAAIYDPLRNRMIIFGGMAPSRTSDTWALDLASSTWSGLALAGTPPSPRTDHTATYDPVRDRMIVFGGYQSSHGENDLWALEFSPTMRWTKLDPPGPLPPKRSRHQAVYDPYRDRMIVFGGYDPVTQAYLNDTWILELSPTPHWSKIETPVAPAPREACGMIYDPVYDRVVLFGGTGQQSYNDVWALPLGWDAPVWTQLATSGGPPAVAVSAGVIYDQARDRMLVVGGYDGQWRHEVWALSLTDSMRWTQLPALTTQNYYRVVYDPARDRLFAMTMAGGYPDRIYGMSELELSNPVAWNETQSDTMPNLLPAGMIYDAIRDRLVFFGGADDYFLSGDTWTLTWGQPIRPVVICGDPILYDPVSHPTVYGTFGVSNPCPIARRIDWAITDQRGWMQPRRGTLKINAFATGTVYLFETIPRYTGETDRLTFTAWLPEGLAATCVRDLRDRLTPVTASLVTAEVKDGHAFLAWQVSTSVPIVVQRHEEGSGWSPLATITSHDEIVRFEDREIHPGRRYGYRIAWTEQGGEIIAGEAWINVSQGFELALLGTRPNPATDGPRIAFTLPSPGSVQVELLDIQGRLQARKALSLDAGYHLVTLGAPGSQAPGVYLARLVFGDQVRVMRTVILR